MTAEARKIPQAALPRGFLGRIALCFMNIGHRSIYTNVARALALQPDDDVLEVGCGNGHFLKKYASPVHSVAGLDLSELCIRLATKKHSSRVKAGTAEFVQGDASQLPWENGTFSAVTSMGSFIMFPKPLESLREMHRVLSPGGRAIVGIEWNADDGMDHSKETEEYGMWLWTEDEVTSMMKEAGFSEVSVIHAKAFKMPNLMIAAGVK
jgi:ubiquinone/menaquinone biosynthesis C-methylase UbiE